MNYVGPSGHYGLARQWHLHPALVGNLRASHAYAVIASKLQYDPRPNFDPPLDALQTYLSKPDLLSGLALCVVKPDPKSTRRVAEPWEQIYNLLATLQRAGLLSMQHFRARGVRAEGYRITMPDPRYVHSERSRAASDWSTSRGGPEHGAGSDAARAALPESAAIITGLGAIVDELARVADRLSTSAPPPEHEPTPPPARAYIERNLEPLTNLAPTPQPPPAEEEGEGEEEALTRIPDGWLRTWSLNGPTVAVEFSRNPGRALCDALDAVGLRFSKRDRECPDGWWEGPSTPAALALLRRVLPLGLASTLPASRPARSWSTCQSLPPVTAADADAAHPLTALTAWGQLLDMHGDEVNVELWRTVSILAPSETPLPSVYPPRDARAQRPVRRAVCRCPRSAADLVLGGHLGQLESAARCQLVLDYLPPTPTPAETPSNVVSFADALAARKRT